jgi:hypothetical protein
MIINCTVLPHTDVMCPATDYFASKSMYSHRPSRGALLVAALGGNKVGLG